MKTVKFLLPILALTLWTLTSCGDTNKPKDSEKVADQANEPKTETNTSQEDAESVVNIVSANYFEIAAGEQAKTMGTAAAVKEFADMMVKDHTMMNDETKALAAKKNFTVPSMMGNDYMSKIDDMKKWVKGKEYDMKFADNMVEGHQKVLDELEKRARDTKDPEVKAWAEKGAAAVRMHIDKARALDTQMEEMYKNKK